MRLFIFGALVPLLCAAAPADVARGGECSADDGGARPCPIDEICMPASNDTDTAAQDGAQVGKSFCVCVDGMHRVKGVCLLTAGSTATVPHATIVPTASPPAHGAASATSTAVAAVAGVGARMGIVGPHVVQLPAASVRYEAALFIAAEAAPAHNDNSSSANASDAAGAERRAEDDAWYAGAQFLWTLSNDDQTSSEAAAESSAWNERVLQLRQLKPGDYQLHVAVSQLPAPSDVSAPAGGRRSTLAPLGDTLALRIVKEVTARRAPVARIRPNTTVRATSDQQIVLDGSASTPGDGGDGGQLAYHWELLAGPALANEPPLNAQVLTMARLKPAAYTFGLTVTDAGGQSGTAKVDVVVSEPRDDPPVAVAGQCVHTKAAGGAQSGDFEVRLPADKVYICGNRSTDDHKIASYSWKGAAGNQPVDVTGTGSSTLTLAQLQEGTYKFTLTVTDDKGHSDSAHVTVFVLKAENKRPVAALSGAAAESHNVTVELPAHTALLDGTASSDDGRIDAVLWTCEAGPNEPTIHNGDKLKATASELVEGEYKFVLNVTDDDGLWSTVELYVNVVHSNNRPPVIVAPDAVSIELADVGYGAIDASKSADDAGIVRYAWAPNDNCTVALQAYAPSQARSVLELRALSAGAHSVNVTVYDAAGLSSTKRVAVNVAPAPADRASVEAYLDADVTAVTVGTVTRFAKRLESIIAGELQSADIVTVNLTSIQPDWSTGRTRVVFHASTSVEGGQAKLLNGRLVALAVTKYAATLRQQFALASVDEKYCSKACSGHGVCSDYTKRCTCHSYWMANFVAVYVFAADDNCDWSVLYFSLATVLLVATVAGVMWTTGRAPSYYTLFACCRLCRHTAGGGVGRGGASHASSVQWRKKRRAARATALNRAARWHKAAAFGGSKREQQQQQQQHGRTTSSLLAGDSDADSSDDNGDDGDYVQMSVGQANSAGGGARPCDVSTASDDDTLFDAAGERAARRRIQQTQSQPQLAPTIGRQFSNGHDRCERRQRTSSKEALLIDVDAVP